MSFIKARDNNIKDTILKFFFTSLIIAEQANKKL